jgi:serine/threonine protein kinase
MMGQQQQQQTINTSGHGEKLYHAPKYVEQAHSSHASKSRSRRSILYCRVCCATHRSTHLGRRLQISITDFDFIQRLGDGSFSTVVLGRYKGDGRCYAVKIVNKSLVLRNKVCTMCRSHVPTCMLVLQQLRDSLLFASICCCS